MNKREAQTTQFSLHNHFRVETKQKDGRRKREESGEWDAFLTSEKEAIEP